jgi:hypothetical protein
MTPFVLPLQRWHKTRSGLVGFGLVELLLAYVFASFAINNGNLWFYLAALILIIGALHNFFKLLGRLINSLHT